MQDEAEFERSGRFPGKHLLRSAARVLSIVGFSTQPLAAMRASYRSTPSGGILSSEALFHAERWLVDQGWLTDDGTALSPEPRCRALPIDEDEIARELVRVFILDSPPTWLSAVAGRGDVRAELLPAQADQLLRQMFTPEERNSILLAAATKFDDAALRALGEAGEKAVVSACRAFLRDSGRPDLANEVRRVSLTSDAVGYDVVSPDLTGREHRLEVKCYRGPRPNFYLTRNEFEVGSGLPRWHLVLCRSTLVTEVIGWTSLASFRDRMPQELDRSARWQVVRVTLEESDLRPGLPIEPAVGPSEPDAPNGDQATPSQGAA